MDLRKVEIKYVSDHRSQFEVLRPETGLSEFLIHQSMASVTNREDSKGI
jgi:hypothetical protein